jgi:hypothetical protein
MNSINERTDLAEVWQDVVSKRHLLLSVIIGVVLSLGGYIGGYSLFSKLNPSLNVDLIKGYALFLGIGGCMIAAFVCCVLFKPKRILTEMVSEEKQVLEALKEEDISVNEELAALKSLPPEVRKELEDVGAYQRLIEIMESNQNKN